MKTIAAMIAGTFACASPFAAGIGQAQAEGQRNDTPNYETRYYAQNAQTGVVQSVEEVKGTNGGNRVAGTILGGVVGGVLGHQLGSGRGNDVATVAGALGGAAVGHQIGRDKGTQDFYRVTVRLDDGSTRVFEQGSVGAMRSGDRVRVDGNVVSLHAGAERNTYQPAYQPAYPPPPPEAYRPDDPASYDEGGRGRAERDGVRTDSRGYRYDRDGNRLDDRPTYRDARTRPEPAYAPDGEERYDSQGYPIEGRR